ncbi:kelch repeat and BTB domain-containing protein 8-like [Branchiostoma lanceolatum]|uniref:kelch repeat and BTB domain-containing protein 8-like n=1 Tax=Branchiostoma lanceolatum TaxID=7740 RepID=UPI00345564A8
MDVTNEEYLSVVLRGLNGQRERAELTDVVLEVGDRSFPCHRAVLALCSPYFRGMFTSGYMETKQERISIQKVNGVAMATILDYAYTGCLQTEPDQVQAVMSAARLLQVDFIYQKAAEYMKGHLDVSNCPDVFMYADMLGDSTLQEASGKYVASRFNQVALQPSFLQLSLPLLQSLLNRDDLMTNSEDNVAQAALQWITFNQEERLQHLPALCKSFRHSFISSKLCKELESKCPSTDSKLVYSDSTSQRLGQTRTDMQIAVLREASTEMTLFTRCFDLSRGTRYIMNLPDKLEAFSMIKTDKDELYLAGGIIIGTDGICMTKDRESQKTFYQYNHLLNTWEPKCKMTSGRVRCCLVCLDRYIYAIGGGRTHRTAERYDPSCDEWTLVRPIPYPMPRAQSYHLSSVLCAVALNDNIYVISSEGCYCFSPTENKWSKTAPMLSTPWRPQAVTYRGCIYCVDHEDPDMASVEMYNPQDGVWIPSDKARTFYCTSLALMLHGASLYLLTVLVEEASGYKEHNLYQYQPETDSWLKPESADMIVTPLKRWLEAYIIEHWLMARMIPTCLDDVSSNDGRRLGSDVEEELGSDIEEESDN